jgi:hypothetical protein
MSGKLFGFIAAAALLASIGTTSAKDPETLTDGQFAEVTAGATNTQVPVNAVLFANGSSGPGGVNQFSPSEGNHVVGSVLEIRHDGIMIQKWDLSCGAAALGTLLHGQLGEPVTEKEIAHALMGRTEYVAHPELVQLREGFCLAQLPRWAIPA